ncbi:TrmH family RNA methyltransferase [Brevibacillus fulvus]|uniref:TrmH family RNA methyltransferase n=1 Tax=Brevibacillus fulvus TaxID=1125967 RepID=A0A939BUZ3_9BACL|nr:RNA methyltransferase [Brevibacillus fulvus]MBM7590116.1 TrmH family RNA methyltransferase [Brevibacillus fulvus]
MRKPIVETINSPQNPLVKRLYHLLDRKGREETGTYLVEGAHLVEEALLSEAEVLTLIYDGERGLPAACERALQRRGYSAVKLVEASSSVVNKLSETKSPQGIIAEVRKQNYDWQTWLSSRQADCLLLFLDELQDPGNLGTILRTAEAAGVDGVVLGNGSVDLYNGKVVRATMGAIFRLPVFSLSLEAAGDTLKQAGGRLLVTTLHGESSPYDHADYSGMVGIVIGNEGRGVSAAMLAAADRTIHIPLYGKGESLNAAVAAGIIVYEARRQRK